MALRLLRQYNKCSAAPSANNACTWPYNHLPLRCCRWEPAQAIPMEWGADGVWRAAVTLPSGRVYTYRYRCSQQQAGDGGAYSSGGGRAAAAGLGVGVGDFQGWQSPADSILSVRASEEYIQVIDDWSADPSLSKVVSASGTEGRQERLVNLLSEIVRSTFGQVLPGAAAAAAGGGADGLLVDGQGGGGGWSSPPLSSPAVAVEGGEGGMRYSTSGSGAGAAAGASSSGGGGRSGGGGGGSPPPPESLAR